MALISEGQEYASPSKRLKLDQSQNLSTSSVELDLGAFSAPLKNVHKVIGGEYSVSAEVLHCGDSGFNDLTSVITNNGDSNQHTSTVLDTSVHSSIKSEDFGTASSSVDDDRDEMSSTVSNLSEISGFSILSGNEWNPSSGPIGWVHRQMLSGANPRYVLNQLLPDETAVPEQVNDYTLWKMIVSMVSDPPRRQKLRHINTLSDVVRLLRGAQKVIVLTGAGVSVSCGIPDFRSRDGIYARLAEDFPDLPDPQAMFDIKYFSQDPRPFFKFAREIYPGQFKPSPCHRFIKMLEKHKKLLRNYSQNIDTLEQIAGIQNVIECHGSFATASCMQCKYKVTADEIRDDIFAQRIPLCPKCVGSESRTVNQTGQPSGFKGVMKPDIVFFGEGLPEVFHECMDSDKDECDLLIVIGSSLKVRPVALLPSSIPDHVPQILINREPLPHIHFDVELLGDSDVIINQICHMLGDGWTDVCWRPPLTEVKALNPAVPSYQTTAQSDVYSDCSQDSHTLGTEESQSLLKYRRPRFYLSNLENDAHSSNMSNDNETQVLNHSNCSTMKERHMSVDSSTGDSGLSFSVDSPSDSYPQHKEKALLSCDDESISEDEQNEKRTTVNITSCNGFNNSANENQPTTQSCNGASDNSEITTQSTGADTAECDMLTKNRCSSVVHQHATVDSTMDSGIVDGSSSVGSSLMTKERRMSLESDEDRRREEHDLESLRGCWQPKLRESIVARLPENSFYHNPPHQYIFPGAEVYYEVPESAQSQYSSSSSSECSDSGSSSLEDESDIEVGADYWDERRMQEKPTGGWCP